MSLKLPVASNSLVMPSGNYSPTASMAVVSISSTNMELTLPTPGIYIVGANITCISTSGSGELRFSLYTPHNTTNITSNIVQITSTTLYTSSSLATVITTDAVNRTVQVRVKRDTGLAGAQVLSTGGGLGEANSVIWYAKIG